MNVPRFFTAVPLEREFLSEKRGREERKNDDSISFDAWRKVRRWLFSFSNDTIVVVDMNCIGEGEPGMEYDSDV